VSVSGVGNGSALQGRHILLVEDEMLISMLLEDYLVELGCVVVGPAGHVQQAVDLAARERIDGALLDVNISGGTAYPVAEKLASRGIPFAFVTGYGVAHSMGAFSDRPVLGKPLESRDQLAQLLRNILY